jgi:hypothetical protein
VTGGAAGGVAGGVCVTGGVLPASRNDWRRATTAAERLAQGHDRRAGLQHCRAHLEVGGADLEIRLLDHRAKLALRTVVRERGCEVGLDLRAVGEADGDERVPVGLQLADVRLDLRLRGRLVGADERLRVLLQGRRVGDHGVVLRLDVGLELGDVGLDRRRVVRHRRDRCDHGDRDDHGDQAEDLVH